MDAEPGAVCRIRWTVREKPGIMAPRHDGHTAVLDRGIGVPAGEERKIFEHFYRAHDSLSSGIQGSGLGLVRVRAEGEMTMSYTINDDRVCILAQTHVGRSR